MAYILPGATSRPYPTGGAWEVRREDGRRTAPLLYNRRKWHCYVSRVGWSALQPECDEAETRQSGEIPWLWVCRRVYRRNDAWRAWQRGPRGKGNGWFTPGRGLEVVMRFEHLDLSENADRVLCIRSRWVAGLRCGSGRYCRVVFVVTSQGDGVVARWVGSGEGRVSLNQQRPTVGKLASPHARRVASRKPAFSLISYLPPSSRQRRQLETSGTSPSPHCSARNASMIRFRNIPVVYGSQP